MPVKRTNRTKSNNRLGGITLTVFTSLVAPTLVSLFTAAIKADSPSRTHVGPPRAVQVAAVSPTAPLPAVVKLLPPTTARPVLASLPSDTRPVPLARRATDRPAN